MSKPSSEEFERAFVATSYLLGVRGEALVEPLPEPNLVAGGLVQSLMHPDRTRRARALAPELARLVQALDARKL